MSVKYSVICQIGLKQRFLWVEGLACASVSLRLLITVSRTSLHSVYVKKSQRVKKRCRIIRLCDVIKVGNVVVAMLFRSCNGDLTAAVAYVSRARSHAICRAKAQLSRDQDKMNNASDLLLDTHTLSLAQKTAVFHCPRVRRIVHIRIRKRDRCFTGWIAGCPPVQETLRGGGDMIQAYRPTAISPGQCRLPDRSVALVVVVINFSSLASSRLQQQQY